jgi:hypothetical protein
MTDHTRQPFNNSATQAEKKQVLRDTMHTRAMAEFSLEHAGRHAKQNTVIGTGAPNYPAGPAWSVDPTGVEPPLGVDVNAVEPCGESFEVARSLGAPALADLPSAPSSAEGAALTDRFFSSFPVQSSAAPNPKPKLRRR